MQRVRSVEPSSVKAAFLHVQLLMFQIALDWSRMIHTLSVASPIMTVSQPSCLVCRTLTFRVTCLCASQRHLDDTIANDAARTMLRMMLRTKKTQASKPSQAPQALSKHWYRSIYLSIYLTKHLEQTKINKNKQ